MNRLFLGAACLAQLLPWSLPSAALSQDAPRFTRVDSAAGEAPEARGESAAAPSPRGAIALRDAIAAALLGSPQLAAFSWEIRAREARALQAGAFPNPQVAVEVENIGGSGDRSGVEQTETTIWLAQLVELGGKRGKRRQVAALARDLAKWDYAADRIQVLTATTEAFVRALAAQLRLALAEELMALAGRSADDAAKRVAAGAAPPVDRSRADLQLYAAQVERRKIAAARAASYAALGATWGETTPRFAALRGDLFAAIGPPPPLGELERRLLEHPAIARWRSAIAARELELSLARAQRLPDPTVALGARHFSDNSDAALVFSVGLPLPIFDRKQADILAAEYDVSQARARAAAARLEAGAALAARHAELAAAYATIKALRERVLPAAEQVFAGARDGYTRGLLRSLEVMDAQRALFDLRVAELDAALAYQIARAEIDGLTAAAVDAGDPGAE